MHCIVTTVTNDLDDDEDSYSYAYRPLRHTQLIRQMILLQCFVWGVMLSVGMGWMFPSQRTVMVALVPKGQETEMMGLVAFFAQIHGWLPTLMSPL